jgi:hypothetical protein
MTIFSSVISIFAGARDSVGVSNYFLMSFQNPLFFVIYLVLFLVFLFISLSIGLFIFSKAEKSRIKKAFYSDFKNSIRVFIFFVIPLLIIAGIIETILISLLG